MSTLAVDQLLPRDHLDATFEGVVSAANHLRTPVDAVRLVHSLRRSLRFYVRDELGGALWLADEPTLLPEPLRRHVPAEMERSARTLEAFARLRASQWRTTILEIFNRMQQDWPDLVTHFGLAPEASLFAISRPLGDSHHDGRSVYRLAFTDGSSLIYKPRSVETEEAFGTLLTSLNTSGCDPDFKSYRALPRTEYGWTEFVPTVFCETTEEITAYYRRQGGLLALFWVLCSSDAIGDNVVISGEHPVWVDSECLSRPDLTEMLKAPSAFPLWMRDSMLVTAMVVYGGGDPDAHYRVSTGLNVSCARDRTLVFNDENVLRPTFLQAVVQGFKDVYRWFLTHDDARSVEHGPLATCCRNRQVRVVLRATQLYTVLYRLLAITPESEKEQVVQAICDVLRAGNPADSRFPEEIVSAEIHALLNADVPYWTASTASCDLSEVHGGAARAAASASCVECIERRISRMSASDLGRQAWLLECLLSGAVRRQVTVTQ